VAQQRAQRKRREETQRRIDLRAARDRHELQCADGDQRGGEARLAAHGAPAEIVDEEQDSTGGEERRNQE
jgi:hypothetical protein